MKEGNQFLSRSFHHLFIYLFSSIYFRVHLYSCDFIFVLFFPSLFFHIASWLSWSLFFRFLFLSLILLVLSYPRPLLGSYFLGILFILRLVISFFHKPLIFPLYHLFILYFISSIFFSVSYLLSFFLLFFLFHQKTGKLII